MGCLPKIRMPARITRLFKKKDKAGPAHQALELGQISHPREVRRIDSKGNVVGEGPVAGPVAGPSIPLIAGPTPSLDAVGGDTPSISNDLASPSDLYGHVVPMTDGTVDPGKVGAETKQDAPGDVGGPAPKDV
ncbi:hypothetical protein FLONG3_5983 [Fusarium longipes]|uniref:Uncharacterized protein n=1 Tax=Fusarium longipes TaxID=694270 RepID=A0A395SQY9_9HYPO|nr:hypothetical protein FLONG3_5983 [Fusarium longipes]